MTSSRPADAREAIKDLIEDVDTTATTLLSAEDYFTQAQLHDDDSPTKPVRFKSDARDCLLTCNLQLQAAQVVRGADSSASSRYHSDPTAARSKVGPFPSTPFFTNSLSEAENA